MKEIPGEHVRAQRLPMKAVCIHEFGGLEAIKYEELSRPVPGNGQALLRVKAAGVGPWDGWVRAGKSVLTHQLPLILGSDLSGIIEEVGPDVYDFKPNDEVFGVTNPQFTGAYAEYALVETAMIARKPMRLNYIEAASVPVVASTAWQMVFEHSEVDSTKRVLVHGAAGNVGAYVVQLAKLVGALVIATSYTRDVEYVLALGADEVIDVQEARFDERVKEVDVVIDTVGGEIIDRSFELLKAGGALISSVAMPDQGKAARYHVRAAFFLVKVTTAGLGKLADLLDSGQLRTNVGEVLPLSKARIAHEMLAGRPHKRGKIVLEV